MIYITDYDIFSTLLGLHPSHFELFCPCWILMKFKYFASTMSSRPKNPKNNNRFWLWQPLALSKTPSRAHISEAKALHGLKTETKRSVWYGLLGPQQRQSQEDHSSLPPLPPLFLKLFFARDLFLEICFCVIF